MSKARMMNWLNKGLNAVSTAGKTYVDVTNKVERTIMKKCGSERMMDDVVGEASSVAMAKTVSATTKYSTIIKERMIVISNRVRSTVTGVQVSAVSKEKQHVPMCRPIPYIDGSYAPLSGMPVVEYTPAPMSVVGRMHAHVAAGRISTRVAVCK